MKRSLYGVVLPSSLTAFSLAPSSSRTSSCCCSSFSSSQEIEHDPPSYIRGKLEEQVRAGTSSWPVSSRLTHYSPSFLQGFGRGGRALLRHRRLAGLPLDSDGVLLPLTNGAWPTQREIEGLAAFIDGNKGGSEGGEGEGRGAEGSGGGEGEETEERSRAEGSEPSTAAGLAGIEAAVGPGQLTAMSLLRDSVHAEWFARLFGSSEDRDIWRSSDSGPGSSSSAAAAAPLSPPGAALSHSAALSSEGKEERRRSKDGEAVPSTPVSVLQRQVKRLSQRRKELLEEDGEEENNSDGDDSGSEGAISVASSAVVPLAGKVLGRQNAKQLSHGTASLLAKKEALAEVSSSIAIPQVLGNKGMMVDGCAGWCWDFAFFMFRGAFPATAKLEPPL